MFGDVIWVIVVIAFWMFMASMVFIFVKTISAGRDDDETVCELTETMSGDRLAPAP
ncbi:MAG: hypothetical protein ACRDHE_08160 [Ktedonobacterales bacterium]